MKKSALIIANWNYEDPLLRGLVSPRTDADALAQVLGDARIGGFDVQILTNAPSHKVCEEAEAFFGDRERDDLLLFYFSGHGVTDDDGALYYAASNTLCKRLRSTAVPASFVNDIMNGCRSRRQVLLLDCCHAGAFARTKAATGAVNVGKYFSGPTPEAGRGKFILTASDAFQYSFEGDAVEGKGVRSVFTEAVVEGLQSGAADLDGDGQITLDELYSFVYTRVRERNAYQTPRKWASDVEGAVVIATNPQLVEAPLPEDLQAAIDSLFAEAREKAVPRLDRLLRGKHRGLSLAAHNALVTLAEEDSRRVSSAAEKCLAAWNQEHATEKPGPVEQPKAEADAARNPDAQRAENSAEPQRLNAQDQRVDPSIDRQARVEPVRVETVDKPTRIALEAIQQAAREADERDRLEKQKAETLRIEKEANEYAARKRAERLLVEEAESRRIADAEAAKERAAAEQAAREQAERDSIAAALAAAERRAEKAEAERLPREEAEAARKANTERMKRERAETAQTEVERVSQLAGTTARGTELAAPANAEPAEAPRRSRLERSVGALVRMNARTAALAIRLESPLLLSLRLYCGAFLANCGMRQFTGTDFYYSAFGQLAPPIVMHALGGVMLFAGSLLFLGIASRLAALILFLAVGLNVLFRGNNILLFLRTIENLSFSTLIFSNPWLVAGILVVLGPGRIAGDSFLLWMMGSVSSASSAPREEDSGSIKRPWLLGAIFACVAFYARMSSFPSVFRNALLMWIRIYCGLFFVLDGLSRSQLGYSKWLVLTDSQVPALAALLSPFVEVLVGGLLVLGIASRAVALLALLQITVTTLLSPYPASWWLLIQPARVWYAPLFWQLRFWLGDLIVLILGPGSFAIGGYLTRRWLESQGDSAKLPGRESWPLSFSEELGAVSKRRVILIFGLFVLVLVGISLGSPR